jgi:hypothetical protein
MTGLAALTQVAFLALSTLGGFVLAALFLREAALTQVERTVLASLIAFSIPSVITLWLLFVAPPGHLSIRSASGITTLIVMVSLAIAYRSTRAGNSERTGSSLESMKRSDGLSLAIIGGISAFQLLAASLKPVMAVDALLYHGGTVALLTQNGSLWGWDAISAYSFYADLVSLQAAQFFAIRLDTNWLDFVQPFYLFFLGALVYSWLRRSTTPVLALGITTVLLATPAIYAQARFFYVDVAFAALLVGAAFAGARWSRTLDRRLLIVALALLGVSASVKPSGIVLIVPALIIASAVATFHRRLTSSLVAVLPLFFCLAPFYIRNLVEQHNPVYPLQLPGPLKALPSTIRVQDLYAGLVPAPLEGLPGPVAFAANLWISATDGSQVLNYDVRLGGFGYGAAILLALLAAAAAVALKRKTFPRRCIPPLLIALILIALQTEAWYPRYSIAAFSLLLVVGGIGTCALRGKRVFITALGIALCVTSACMMIYTEAHMLGGVREIKTWSANPSYNHGIHGWNPSYDLAYEWTDQLPCGSVVLIPEDQLKGGLYGAYNFGLYGDHLCNVVNVVPSGALPRRDWDYLVSQRWSTENSNPDGCATVVGYAPAVYGEEQVILKNCTPR